MIKMSDCSVFVTVLMPVYNGENYLKEAIESILHQSHEEFELLIINDGSSDSTESIILSFDDARIRYIKNQDNLGLIETLNLGFTEAKGKYIARMDADDISHPLRLEKQILFLERNSQVGLLGTACSYIGDKEESAFYPDNYENIKFACLFYNPFCHPSVMIRKEIIDTHQFRFKKKYIHAEEYKLWTELLSKTKAHNLKDKLLFYRSHQAQVSQIHVGTQLNMNKMIQREYLEEAGFVFEMHEWDFIFRIKETACGTLSSKELMESIRAVEKLIDQNRKLTFFDEEIITEKFSLLIKNSILELKTVNKKMFRFIKENSMLREIFWTCAQKNSLKIKFLKGLISNKQDV